VVARAYLDQLARGSSLAPKRIVSLNDLIAKAEASPSDNKTVDQMKAMGSVLEKDASAAKTPADAERMRALASILKDRTSRL
jgi:ribonuclease D